MLQSVQKLCKFICRVFAQIIFLEIHSKYSSLWHKNKIEIMKKLNLLLMLLNINVCLASDPPEIPLHENEGDREEQRNETGTITFSAEILSNRKIKIQASGLTTFSVRILDGKGTPIYEGSTVLGVLHISTESFLVGHYTLFIEGYSYNFSGSFQINE